MTTDERVQRIGDTFRILRQQGIIKTWTDFAKLIETNRSVLSAAKNGDEKYLTDNLMEKIDNVLTLPGISISNSPHTNVATNHSQINIGNPTSDNTTETSALIPVIPRNIYKESDVNIVEYLEDNEEKIQLSSAVHQFPKTTCYYTVDTMAMYPLFHQGDILALKAISQSAPIVNGEVYAIDSRELGILIRFAYDRGDKIELRNSDTSSRFEPFFVEKSDIFTIFRVVGLMRTNI